MLTCLIDSTELRSRGGFSSKIGCGSSCSRRSSMDEAMREQQ
jgi:hypothetical protein